MLLEICWNRVEYQNETDGKITKEELIAKGLQYQQFKIILLGIVTANTIFHHNLNSEAAVTTTLWGT
jgi:hypothetical protein